MTALALMRAAGEISIGLFAVFVLIALASWYGVLRVVFGVLVAIVLFASWDRANAATLQTQDGSRPMTGATYRADLVLLVNTTEGLVVCPPVGVVYSADLVLAVPGFCPHDAIFSGSFDGTAGSLQSVTHAKGAWLSLTLNSSSAAGPRSGRASRVQL